MGHPGQADRISPADAKIARERSVLEAARQRSTFFPPGDLLRDEPPDWLIPSASLGIEVSDLLPAKPHGAKFSGPQVSSFQQDVAIIAEELYYASHDAQPAAVLLYFRNDWTRKGDVEQTARALAGFVHSNYPRGSEECVTLTSMSRTVRGWVDGLSVVRILRAKGTWQAGGCSEIACLTQQQVADRIAAKDLLLPEYRRRWPSCEMWLLLCTRTPVLQSVWVPREITEWNFATEFDRLLLSSWEGEVLELRRMPRKKD